MARLSHGLLGALNLVTLLLSLPMLCAGVYFRMRAATECERALQVPVIALGCALLLLSLVGLAGACGRRPAAAPFLWAYVVAVFLLVVAVFAFTVFAFEVTNRGAGSAVSGRGYREYRLGDYSGWLQARIAEPETWRRVESCLAEARVCGQLDGAVGQGAMDFYRQHLSPVQSGCCKPPTRCGFRYVNATFWETPRSGMSPEVAGVGGDCRAWSNDQQVLCFECDACKAGMLATVKKKWKAVWVVNVALLAVLVLLYTLGCCALRSNAGSRYYNGGGA
ncbi:tetraspanin-8-like [Phragmites australis]|uniref:tetraspanin-8-like n=1 Tax=Phragmites australis TaxID=29695 RepID=UPI002D78D5B8|nr:tetraspanin-8-like [Phragmites australis]